jgi:hypothetical protein
MKLAGELGGEVLLDLKAAGEAVHQRGEAGDSDHGAVGVVGEVDHPMKGQQVVGTGGDEGDVPDGDDVPAPARLERLENPCG